MRALKPRQREALYLKGLGYRYTEIMRLTGATYTAVNRRITEGRAGRPVDGYIRVVGLEGQRGRTRAMDGHASPLVVVHPTCSCRASADSGCDERLLTAKHAYRGLTIVVAITCEVKKSMDGVADQLLTVRDVTLISFSRGEV
jgi:hypothetical protein